MHPARWAAHLGGDGDGENDDNGSSGEGDITP